MKKILALLLLFTICISLCACGEGTKTPASVNYPEVTDSVYYYRESQHHLYKATFLSDVVVKVEYWNRWPTSEETDPFEFDYDVCVFSVDDPAYDFKWIDDSHIAFSILLLDEGDSLWKEHRLVMFTKSTVDG